MFAFFLLIPNATQTTCDGAQPCLSCKEKYVVCTFNLSHTMGDFSKPSQVRQSNYLSLFLSLSLPALSLFLFFSLSLLLSLSPSLPLSPYLSISLYLTLSLCPPSPPLQYRDCLSFTFVVT